MLEFGVLGPLVVRSRAESYSAQGPFQATLLISLLVADGRPVHVCDLVHELWGGGHPARPDNALQAHISRLRRRLERLEPQRPTPRLITRPSSYQLIVEPGELDGQLFTSAVARLEAEAATHRPQWTVARLREALSLWRGPVFGGIVGGHICQSAAQTFDEARLRAYALLFDAELARGRHSAIIAELRALLTSYSPFHDRFCEQLMTALYRSGRQAEALETYRQTCEQLARIAGRQPSERLRMCEHMVLVQDPALGGPLAEAALAVP
ncbi:DNA-binding SARP family transcriptional activator [Streptomyces olivoverticillatus]|uniref:DNA-binding SARP family transcriptional activator n=1 Tax=Streptomyces olivoverticillatus TaxID=66427 RepID=A0A7W7LP44_9ACTN|nr:AfsR/SARP family transcriptional regulator [Streptomyces olivoverticillatus]MBB4893669.1 DNA-binding SARP family transcriptional activator [Streptomyces olivoverticillatus]